MAMFHSVAITFCADTNEDLSGVIQSLIQDDFRTGMTLEYSVEDNTYFVSYEESGYCQISEVLSYARSLAEECPSLNFAMDALAQNEGSGGNYRDHVSACYSHGWLRYEHYSDSEVYRPEVVSAPEDGFEEMRLVKADLEQLFEDEESETSFDKDHIPDFSSASASTVIFNYDEKVSFRLSSEYYISKAEYDEGFICLVSNELDNEEEIFNCAIKLLPLNTGLESLQNCGESIKYLWLPAPPTAMVIGELSKGKKFDFHRKYAEGYEIGWCLGVQVPQGYILVLEGMAFVYEGQSGEQEEKNMAGFRRMLEVMEAVRVNGEPLQLCGLTPELLRSVIAPSPDEAAKVIDVSEKLLA